MFHFHLLAAGRKKDEMTDARNQGELRWTWEKKPNAVGVGRERQHAIVSRRPDVHLDVHSGQSRTVEMDAHGRHEKNSFNAGVRSKLQIGPRDPNLPACTKFGILRIGAAVITEEIELRFGSRHQKCSVASGRKPSSADFPKDSHGSSTADLRAWRQ